MSIQSKEGFKSGDASLYIRVYLFEDSFIPLFRDAPTTYNDYIHDEVDRLSSFGIIYHVMYVFIIIPF
jgi:hypothetical protein